MVTYHKAGVIFFGFAFIHKPDDYTPRIEETKVIFVSVDDWRSMPASRQ